jgi:hypothetical protein
MSGNLVGVGLACAKAIAIVLTNWFHGYPRGALSKFGTAEQN